MTIQKLAEDLVSAKLIWDTASHQYYKFDTGDKVDARVREDFIYAAGRYRSALNALVFAVLKQKVH